MNAQQKQREDALWFLISDCGDNATALRSLSQAMLFAACEALEHATFVAEQKAEARRDKNVRHLSPRAYQRRKKAALAEA